MTSLAEIGSQIAQVRRAHKFRQADLAAKARVSRATIDALENARSGDIGYSKLSRILSVVGLELALKTSSSQRPTLDDLLQESGDD